MLLVELLREDLDLTGTHVGCDTTYCGACTVLMNGAAVKSCTMFAVQADGAEILTVEGLEKDGQLHPIQKAFGDAYGLQCGYCTPGLMLSTLQLLVTQSATQRKRYAQSDCRQYLPLHGIPEYSQGHTNRRAEHERCLSHGDQVCRRI